MKKIILLGLTISIGLFSLPSCSSSVIEKEITKDIHISKDKSKELDLDLILDYGTLHLSSGSEDWISGEVTYNHRKLKPEITYKNKRKLGKATISQPKDSKLKFSDNNLKNNWDLQLTKDIPVDLTITTGASDTYMDLKETKLSKLVIDAGVGRTKIDLSGNWENSFDTKIDLGVGEATIILPKKVGVKVKLTKGIGLANFAGLISKEDNIYVNKAFANADIILTVHAELGVGEANFEVEE